MLNRLMDLAYESEPSQDFFSKSEKAHRYRRFAILCKITAATIGESSAAYSKWIRMADDFLVKAETV